MRAEIVAGHARLNDALVLEGKSPLGKNTMAKLWAGAAFLLGPSKRRVASKVSAPEVFARAERDLRTNAAIGYFDPLAGIRELHIGHAIVSRAVFIGMRAAVREMKDLLLRAAHARA